MHVSMIEWLRCPFCGTHVTLVDASPTVRDGDELVSGVLGCECCAFPVVAGIPVLIADDTTRLAMHQLEAGQGAAALLTLLGLEGDRATAFSALLASPAATYRSALEVLSPDPEGTYFLYRFSDPTYVMAQSVLQVIGQNPAFLGGRAIDLCGGSGHLTRVLVDQGRAGEVVLADVFFWKLWLARTFTAPQCQPVCCDANHPLPFARETFQLVVLSDAFPYIWHKRLLADEMVRLATPTGAIVMPHLHSSLGENFSAGMTLTPASYRDLFEVMEPRLYRDATLLDGILGHATVDLGASVSAEALGTTPSLTLVASRQAALFKRYALPPFDVVRGELRVNPLFRVEHADGQSRLTLDFPNADYEEEFGECRRYLPDSMMLEGDARRSLDVQALGDQAERLRRMRVLIDAPVRYF
ncbi:MAG: class I SAM-dependent methyltransferase [Vicinamibacterales bacterium]